MSQEDRVISSESEAEVTLRGSEEGESGSEAEFEHLRRDSGSPAHNQAHSSFLVQLKTQATDGDGHGVSQARLVGASPSSTLDVHVDQGQERPRPVDDVILIRPHTETSHIRKTSWPEDSIYPLNQQDFSSLSCLNWLASLMPWNAHHAHHAMEKLEEG